MEHREPYSRTVTTISDKPELLAIINQITELRERVEKQCEFMHARMQKVMKDGKKECGPLWRALETELDRQQLRKGIPKEINLRFSLEENRIEAYSNDCECMPCTLKKHLKSLN